eukprot:TRINITY_DN6977_c0_g1_i1.p1 TRINITY_DN6977_c0_g1~~TRINITY_DN6977_c0_g1_i1.p1  ORF type:complete len:450 (+),score=58.68 TRINITY_DN6977_c0_g1_i1:218-1567(+)
MVRICWLLLAAVATGEVVRFIQITDIHLDQLYKTGSLVNTTCHRLPATAHPARRVFTLAGGNGARSSEHHGARSTVQVESTTVAGRFGVRGFCDSPLALLQAAGEFLTGEQAGDYAFIVWTGDSARHDHDLPLVPRSWDEISSEIAQVTGVLNLSASAPVFPSIGNNDVCGTAGGRVVNASDCQHDALAPGPNPVLANLSAIWGSFLGPSGSVAQADFETSGQYEMTAGTALESLHVISLNTIVWLEINAANPQDCDQPGAPAGYLEWFNATLARVSQQPGHRALVIGHVPPSTAVGSKAGCVRMLTEIVDHWQEIIVGHLYAHLHSDQYFPLPVPGKQVAGVALVAPSVVPSYNSAIRVFSIDDASLELLGYEQYWMDVDVANAAGRVKWELEYSTWDDNYRMANLSTAAWMDLDSRIRGNSTLAALYTKHRFVNGSPPPQWSQSSLD